MLTLDEIELPDEEAEARSLHAEFRRRADDQAASLVESLYLALFVDHRTIPFHSERTSQKRTVRQEWYMEGPFFRARKRTTDNHWCIFVGCLKDRGPAACLILSRDDDGKTEAERRLSLETAVLLGLESSAADSCFTHPTTFDSGLIIGHFPLLPDSSFEEVARSIRDQSDLFFSKLGSQFEGWLQG